MTTAALPCQPAIFVGHGNPMNALRRNPWTEGWRAIGVAMPRPRAILAISAHWYLPATLLTAMARPRTIHDFGGFPRELYAIEYPAPGEPHLAGRVRELLSPVGAELDDSWGLDHGTWSVLYHMFPEADIPVVQLSIDRRQAPLFHYQVGQLLAPLRDEGVLILGSGNLVHNLQAYDWEYPPATAQDWGARFEALVRQRLVAGQDAGVINYPEMGPDARLSAPTPDHYLPLLYVLGARRENEPVDFPLEGFDGGSVSMLAVRLSEGNDEAKEA